MTPKQGGRSQTTQDLNGPCKDFGFDSKSNWKLFVNCVQT